MSKILDLFQGKTFSTPPLWFMRQAGRYLPEYGEIRKKCKGFLDLCSSPEQAAEVTLQPLRRFDLDGAILFSDILTIPHALGQSVTFEEIKGPLLSPLSLSSFQENLSFEKITEKLRPAYETIQMVKPHLSSKQAFFGFAGAPWTLALYMLEGEGSRDFAKAKSQAFQNEDQFTLLLDKLSEVITLHLMEQIKAGVTILQLFDTWAGLCPATHFEKWIIVPTHKIARALKQAFPNVPLLGFPKGIGAHLVDYGHKTGVSGLSLDANTSLVWARKNLPNNLIFQGNLDPLLLVAGGDPLKRAIHSIHENMKERPYIFNLGHGIVPQTPIKNVEDCVKWVRELG
jgi:uroporphyrinogen decarboxylase